MINPIYPRSMLSDQEIRMEIKRHKALCKRNATDTQKLKHLQYLPLSRFPFLLCNDTGAFLQILATFIICFIIIIYTVNSRL